MWNIFVFIFRTVSTNTNYHFLQCLATKVSMQSTQDQQIALNVLKGTNAQLQTVLQYSALVAHMPVLGPPPVSCVNQVFYGAGADT